MKRTVTLLLGVVVCLASPGSKLLAQAAGAAAQKPATPQEAAEFKKQMKEVESKYPLVVKSYRSMQAATLMLVDKCHAADIKRPFCLSLSPDGVWLKACEKVIAPIDGSRALACFGEWMDCNYKADASGLPAGCDDKKAACERGQR